MLKQIWGALIILLVIGGAFGYANNIIKLSNCDFQAPYNAEVIHTVGLIPPIGIFTGYLDLGR